jgi:hypothetical protein
MGRSPFDLLQYMYVLPPRLVITTTHKPGLELAPFYVYWMLDTDTDTISVYVYPRILPQTTQLTSTHLFECEFEIPRLLHFHFQIPRPLPIPTYVQVRPNLEFYSDSSSGQGNEPERVDS